MIGRAGDFADLVFHLLSHVRASGPGSAFDARYVAWSRGAFEASVQARVEEDAEIIGARWHDALHRWPLLHDGLEGLVNTAKQELAAVRAEQVAEASVLTALQAIDDPVTEVVHASLSLLAGPWREVYASQVAPALNEVQPQVDGVISQALVVAPQLGDRRIELSWALGPRGRAMPDRIVVGAPAPWNGQAPILSVVLALHEHAVLEVHAEDYFSAEWQALRVNAARTRNAPDELREAYDAWLAGLDLDGVLARAPISSGDREALHRDAATRGDRLASL